MALRKVILAAVWCWLLVFPTAAARLVIITHGLNDTAVSGWPLEMGRAIARRESGSLALLKLPYQNFGPGTTRWETSVVENSDSDLVVVAFDWSEWANGFFDLPIPDYPNTSVGRPLVDWLVSVFKTDPTVSVHLIGHSRGGSLVLGVAMELGKRGLVTGQVTALDPHPLGADYLAIRPTNTIYCESYFQTDDYRYLGLVPVHGYPVPGAFNRKLDLPRSLVPRSYFETHSDIHHWYHRTIDPTSTYGRGATGAAWDKWFELGDQGGEVAGYYYAVCPAGKRPAVGISTLPIGQPFLNAAKTLDGRTSLSWTGTFGGPWTLRTGTDLQSWSAQELLLFDGRPAEIWLPPPDGTAFIEIAP